MDLYTTGVPRCDCGDHLWRERICKHILAALLREGNHYVVTALGALALRWHAVARAARRSRLAPVGRHPLGGTRHVSRLR